MDFQVLAAQEYLNTTYTGQYGYVPVPENGQTGWATVDGIIRALQIELGIPEPVNNFGPGTAAAFTSIIGALGPASPTAYISLLQCALWCKGYYADTIGSGWTSTIQLSVLLIKNNLGLSTSSYTINVKLMKSLLSMDAYTKLGSGTDIIRSGQQWLNGQYSHRQNFDLLPTDGLFTRQMQKGVVYAIQYEIGMTDAVANGNFGPGTQSGLQTQGIVQLGMSDSTKNFVRLFKILMNCNSYEVSAGATFDLTTELQVTDFQEFMEITVNGKGDFGTWAALLVSTGDPTRPVTGFDTNTPITPLFAAARYAEGYRAAGRYLTVASKAIVPGEMEIIFDAGLKLIPIFQNYNDGPGYFTESIGYDHGCQAATRARELGFHDGVTIYFAVDYDALGDEAHTIVSDYFIGVNNGLKTSVAKTYKVGIYATRNVCSIIHSKGLAEGIWVSGMSTGYSGNLGFRMPSQWQYNQIQELTSINIDRNAVSVRAEPVASSAVSLPPLQGGQFHPFYWGEKNPSNRKFGIMELQVLAERLLLKHGVSPSMVSTFSSEIIMSWLKQESYEGNYDSGNGLIWYGYTPPFEVHFAITGNPLFSSAIIARNEFYSIVGDLHQLDAYYDGGDPQHMAATAHGAKIWGIHQGENSIGIGDFGGWALDLATHWEDYHDSGKTVSVTSWVNTMLGGSGGSFSLEDIIADADGWLVAREMTVSGATFGEAWQTTLRDYPIWQNRLVEFLKGRFGDPFNTSTAFTDALTDLFSRDNISLTSFLRSRFVADTKLPNTSEQSEFFVAARNRLIALCV